MDEAREWNMAASLIDGKSFASGLRGRVASGVSGLAARGIVPGLAVVLVGEDPASAVYVRNKGVQTREAGMASWEHRLPAETAQADLLALIETLNHDPAVHGILVQLPLPKHVDEGAILDAISPHKDADGFHPVNVGALWLGKAAPRPCTPAGVMRLLDEAKVEVDLGAAVRVVDASGNLRVRLIADNGAPFDLAVDQLAVTAVNRT